MIWASFSWYGQSAVKFVDGRTKGPDYTKMLQSGLLPFMELMDRPMTFQQDGAPCHTTAHTMNWLAEKNIPVIDWAAKSPDLNPIENAWGEVARVVYANGKQYDYKTELQEAIIDAWVNIGQDYLRSRVSSMPRRCVRAVEKRGGTTGF